MLTFLERLVLGQTYDAETLVVEVLNSGDRRNIWSPETILMSHPRSYMVIRHRLSDFMSFLLLWSSLREKVVCLCKHFLRRQSSRWLGKLHPVLRNVANTLWGRARRIIGHGSAPRWLYSARNRCGYDSGMGPCIVMKNLKPKDFRLKNCSYAAFLFILNRLESVGWDCRCCSSRRIRDATKKLAKGNVM